MDLVLNQKPVAIDLAVFDCDGVLLESMAAKISAFEQWVPDAHSAYGEAFMKEVMAGFGRARTHHIRTFYEKILGQSVSEAFLQGEVARFTEICEPLCAAAGWRPGSQEFVEVCRAAEMPCYVLSGTPQAALEAMLESTGAAPYFDVIIGSPPAKPESLAHILNETGISPERAVFIGDAEADRAAAEANGVHFAYFPSEADRPTGHLKTEVNDLRELLVQ
ncbi:MAG: HAD family hydrolase [Verrucomicrobia bacterium]|jgi:phosphoglycolate phosphatase-like HAD superfamily hydrolase|nr:HAD family hydrolase [Verrucomicrobiota bacterium]